MTRGENATVPPEALLLVHDLRDLEPDEVVELGKQFQQMIATPGWRAFISILEKHERGLMLEPVQAKAVLTQAQYADIFGQVAGVRAALTLPEAIELLAAAAEEELRRAVQDGEE